MFQKLSIICASLILSLSAAQQAYASVSCADTPDPTAFIVGGGESSKCATNCETMEPTSDARCKTANAHAGARSDQIYNTLRTPEMGCNVSDPGPMFTPTCISGERIFHRKMTSNNCVMPELANDNAGVATLSYQEQKEIMALLEWGNLIEQTKSVCNFKITEHVVPGSKNSGFPDVNFLRLDSVNEQCKILASKEEACPAGYASKPRSVTYQGDTSLGTVVFDSQYTLCKVMYYCVKK